MSEATPELPYGVPNFSWLLPGRLAVSGMPARGLSWEGPQVYLALHGAGVRVVASLLEHAPPVAEIQAAGLESLHFPIGDFGTPKNVDAFRDFLDEVSTRIAAGRPALVHCYAGIGRAGMFAAAYLARHGGFTPQGAIAEVRRLRPGSIETHGQLHVIRLLAAAPK